MSKKYTTPEEDEEIKRLYLTGKFSYEKIGQTYHVSKGTIINIVKSYPYTGDKTEYWQRAYRETVTNMDKVLTEIRREVLECLIKHDSITYNMLMRQEEYLLSFALTDPQELYERLKTERNNIEQTAWGHLSESDYTEFAFFQNLWHKLNKIIGDHRKNPFGEIAEKTGAKSRAKSVKYYSNKDFKEFRQYSRNEAENEYIISDNLYDTLKHCISAHTGRPLNNPRQRLNIILNLFLSGESPQRYPDWRKIYESYATWYRSGLFRAMWEVNEKYPELQLVRSALLTIERHRMIDPINPPRFKEVQGSNRREGRESER